MYLDRLLTLRHAGRFARAFAVAAAVLVLAGPQVGCSAQFEKAKEAVESTIGVISNVRVKSKTAYVAINVFNAAERSVTNVLELPLCGVTTTIVCRPLGAADALDQPFNTGIAARNALRDWMKTNPGTVADAGLYNSLVAATTALKSVMAAYGVSGT